MLRDQMITLNFWDIGGQNIFTRLTSTYYKSALGAIVVCDITDPTSLSGAERWKKDVNEKVKFKGKDIPCILFVNKVSEALFERLTNNVNFLSNRSIY